MTKKFVLLASIFIIFLFAAINISASFTGTYTAGTLSACDTTGSNTASSIWADDGGIFKDRFDAQLTNLIKEKGMLANNPSYQIPFIKNEGQIKDPNVKFYAKTINGTVYINNKGEFIYNIITEKKYLGADDSLLSDGAFPLTGFILKETLIGTDRVKSDEIKGMNPSETTVNYFIGNNPEQWRSNISTYDLLDCGEIWNGIFLNLKADSKNIEKLFIIMPEGNAESIQISVDGAEKLSLKESGEIELVTPYISASFTGTYTTGSKTASSKNIGFTKPVAFQEINGSKKYVEVSYRLINNTSYGFTVGDYNSSLPLVIDPLLSSTFIGGSSTDIGRALIIDPANGNIFVAGYTLSSNYPTINAYDQSWNGGYDIVVSKFNPSLTQLLSSTFIGGGSSDAAFAIALDGLGNVFITGQAGAGFPTLTDLANASPYDTSFNGGSFDVFAAKLNNNLSALLASTYLGGTGSNDAGWGIGIDNSDNVFITGYTDSQSFPTSSNAYDNSYNGGIDAFVSKFNNNLSGPIPGGGFYFASTFIGSSPVPPPVGWPGQDLAYGIAIDRFSDAENYVFIVGVYVIGSPAYPTTGGAYDQSLGGAVDAFVSKFNNNLQTLLASTYLGGTGSEIGYAITMGLPIAGGSPVYVTGTTASADFPVTPNAYNYGVGSGLGSADVFVSRLNNNLSSLLNSTWIGGTDTETSYAIVQNNTNSNIFICGTAESSDYPVTEGVFDRTNAGGAGDVFITSFNDTLSVLLASTFMGGTGQDIAYGIKPDGSGNVIITGLTSSSDYPVWPIAPPWPATSTNLAYDRTYNGGSSDIFVSRITNDLSGGLPQPPAPPITNTPITDTGTGIIGGSSGNEVVYLDADAFRKPIGSCFIASAVYGNPMNSNVIALRNFRDAVLLNNAIGQSLVETYYKTSPKIANYLTRKNTSPPEAGLTRLGGSASGTESTLVRIALLPITYTVKYPLATALGIGILMLLVILGYRRAAVKTNSLSSSGSNSD